MAKAVCRHSPYFIFGFSSLVDFILKILLIVVKQLMYVNLNGHKIAELMVLRKRNSQEDCSHSPYFSH